MGNAIAADVKKVSATNKSFILIILDAVWKINNKEPISDALIPENVAFSFLK